MMLVRTPPPFPSESLIGYVIRLSETNGYETPWHILRFAGIEQKEMRTAGFQVEKLAAILGKEADTLRGIAYQGDDRKPTFKILNQKLGHSLQHAPLRLTALGMCPHCVLESGYIDAFWDLSAAVACPTHKCLVLRNCPSCGAGLSLFRPGLLVCRCGASLADAKLPEAKQSLVELMGVLYAKSHGQNIEKLSNASGLPLQQLAGIHLGPLLWILDILGELNCHSKGLPKPNEDNVLPASVELLEAWPTGYYTFLKRLGARYLAELRFPRFFVFQGVSVMLPVFQLAAHSTSR